MSLEFQLHVEHQKRILNATLPIRSVGYYREHPFWKWPQRVAGIQFCLRTSGNHDSCRLKCNGIEYEGHYPLLVVKRPGDLFLHEEPGLCTCLYFTYPDFMLDELRRRGLSDDLVICELPQSMELNDIIQRIQDLATRPGEFGVVDRLDMLCARLFQELLLHRERNRTPWVENREKIHTIISYLQLNFTHPVNLEELARRNGLSYRTFLRHWKQTGLPPPAQYLAELRMEEAKRLLAETELSIVEITEHLHYCGSAWFCAAFRRSVGKTPLQYRRCFRK